MKREIEIHVRGNEDDHTTEVLFLDDSETRVETCCHSDLEPGDPYIMGDDYIALVKSCQPRTNESRIAFLEREPFYVSKTGVKTYYAMNSTTGCQSLPVPFDTWESCVDAMIDAHEGV